MADRAPALDLRSGPERVFAHLLVNNLLVSVVNYTVWFAVTFWVFLETGSVFATGMIAGIFLVATAGTGIWFGSLVDHHRKHAVLQASAGASTTLYALALAVYLLTPEESFRTAGSLPLWCFIVLLMLGVIAGNPRIIALPTLVTLLVPADRRDRANGLVGSATGLSMLATSVISGLLVAFGGMTAVLAVALTVLVLSVAHLTRVQVPEDRAASPAEGGDDADGSGVDLRGTLRLVRGVPGLLPLILFSCFNNFLGGAFMALMDPYGLSLMSVQAWGLLWGGLSALMIVGGLLVARIGLGSRPIRVLLLVNVAMWAGTMLFPLASSVLTLTVAMAVFMTVMPFAEAAEQTVLQRVVPYERQGRVFGFAQSVEQAASPLTAFLMAPLTEFVVIPFMTDGAGARAIGGWFGTGPTRGIALVFVVTGLIGLVVVLAAFASPAYRRLSEAYARARDDVPAGDAEGIVPTLPVAPAPVAAASSTGP
ncbi:MFS transporter, DHA3 family, multidrug efflux protein [Geodermatophilus amargosae]|uniref:MFS transporter, DHA3 family, multidrug efflux protein n=1 Tax=Geodermatophilus amargosae TaxID=1296565 RepID=A0A1I6ZDN0_9ACTN|nr:MFS transporter [Geodermatophilus amargosae]SFT60809.1 MFS transporter, DHA3 family, multidrug efflux protein [Geodermatophilus amargosae]